MAETVGVSMPVCDADARRVVYYAVADDRLAGLAVIAAAKLPEYGSAAPLELHSRGRLSCWTAKRLPASTTTKRDRIWRLTAYYQEDGPR